MVGRVIGQAHADPMALDEGDQPGHERGALAVILGAVVQIEYQRGDVDAAVPRRVPPPLQAIDEAITGHRGGDVVDEQVVGLGQEESDWRHGRLGPKAVVRRRDGHAALAATGEGTDLDRRRGGHRHPQHVRRRSGLRVHPRHLVEDRVGLGDFFWVGSAPPS